MTNATHTFAKGQTIRMTTKVTRYMSQGDKVIGYPEFEVATYQITKIVRRNGNTRLYLAPVSDNACGCSLVVEQAKCQIEVV